MIQIKIKYFKYNAGLEAKRVVYGKNGLDFTLYNLKVGKRWLIISLFSSLNW